jgi:hypothetical protein
MDLFSTNTLVGVVQDLKTPPSHFLDTEFRGTIEDPSEEIHFDVDESKPRITPFVSPLLPGKVVNDRGFATKTFKPAYAKDKRRWNPNRPLKRVIGEKLGGSLSPEQRVALLVGQTLEDQLAMLTRREEVMAAEALRLGQVTVSGEGFATVVVSFGRHANLRVTLAGNDRWSVTHADSNPLADIENWAVEYQLRSGAVPRRVTFAPDAWRAFRDRLVQRDEWKYILDYRRASESSALDLAPGNGQKARFVGVLGTFELYVYDDIYLDDAGVEQHLMPSGEVVMTGDALEGNRCYAAIQDEAAGYAATRYHVKSWVENDPPVRWLMLQSAPLVVPFRPNASLGAAVL